VKIYTASWFARLPASIQRIGISRGTPRNIGAGYFRLMELAPGPWFKSVTAAEYLARFNAQLTDLDPHRIRERFEQLGGGRDVALLCYENARDIHHGKTWCHRCMVGQWLNDTVAAGVEEYGFPDLDPWASFRSQHTPPPRYGEAGSRPAPPAEPLLIDPWLGRKAADIDGVTWTVIGRSEQFPDQAEIASDSTGEIRVISRHVLEKRFGENAVLL
jgi:hypothetical protein